MTGLKPGQCSPVCMNYASLMMEAALLAMDTTCTAKLLILSPWGHHSALRIHHIVRIVKNLSGPQI